MNGLPHEPEMNRLADTRHKRGVCILSKEKYEDMLHLPHHTSTVHPRMSRQSRAAQFSPFAALTGHEDAIFETGRLTQPQIDLAEDARYELDCKQRILAERMGECPRISITYFLPDPQKTGGSYITAVGVVKNIDHVRNMISLTDGTHIHADSVIRLEGALFEQVSVSADNEFDFM